jgi:GTP-binding protein
MEIRNIAIIAHVDHGKTTLTDAILKQTGFAREGFSMDTNALEQERGITIYAKNASIEYKGTKINIVDTPGHADFGSEVERILRSIDAVLLVVDAQEGPMPQTRFVLKKSLELGLKPLVIINKIDKRAARPKEVYDEVLELFLELGGNEEQLNAPVIYTIGRNGIAKRNLSDTSSDLTPLLDLILETVPKAKSEPDLPLQAQAFNLAYDNFLGRLAVVRIYQGALSVGQSVFARGRNGELYQGKITRLMSFKGLDRIEVSSASSGDIVMVAGLPEIYIGETITDAEETAPLPAISIDEPTIALDFLVNNSPLSGLDGRLLTTRQIRERLERELEVNVGLKVEFNQADNFKVFGRGELHIAILLENMRREGFELQVSQPQVIVKEEAGQTYEPYEEVTIDVPSPEVGSVIERLGKRKGVVTDMREMDGRTRLTLSIPTRGLLGYRGQFTIDTKGEGVLSSRVTGFSPYAGEIKKHETGSMVSMEKGKALAFALSNLQERGGLYIEPGTEVYEGMVIGNTTKGDDLDVNPTKGKQLTNMRASGSDEAIYLTPPRPLTIEIGLELMHEDEYLEITPKHVRLRKKFLTKTDRARAERQGR